MLTKPSLMISKGFSCQSYGRTEIGSLENHMILCNAGVLWTQGNTLAGISGFPPPTTTISHTLSPTPDPQHSRQENSDVSASGIMFCVRRGQRKGVWCVSDRSPGNAAGERLIWPVWSWELTRSHWKWLLLGMAFIFVYLSFFFPWKFFCTNGYCVCVYLQEHLYIPFSCFLSLQGKVVTFWCKLWILINSSFSMMRCLFK